MEAEVASRATNKESDLPRLLVPCPGPTDRLVSLRPVELRDAVTGRKPRLRTAVRVAFRDGSLVVRFDGRDDGTVATLTRRDEPLWTEDVFEVFLTPADPPALYFEFEVNPLGTVFDARVESPDLVRKTMRATSLEPPRALGKEPRPAGPLVGGAEDPAGRARRR